MKTSIKDKIVVVTGAGGGIGREIWKRLSLLGAKLVLLGGNNVAKLEDTASFLQGESKIVPANLTDFENLDCLVQKCKDAFGGVDILINNAGVA